MADLTGAIEAGAQEAAAVYGVGHIGRNTIRVVLEAAVPIIERQVRAEVAEGIAQAIEAKARRDKHGVTAWVYGYRDGLDDAARIARGYTQHTGTPHDDPAQPEQGRDPT